MIDPTNLPAIMHLMMQSPIHSRWSFKGFARLIMPPLRHNQYAVWMDTNGTPIGFVTWAWLTEDAATGYMNATRKLQADDWAAGNQLWFIDMVAPYGGMAQFARQLREAFSGCDVAYARRRGPDGIMRKRRYACSKPDHQSPPPSYRWPDPTSPLVH